jgi:tetratricopeptide (TPR) repeat protein
MNRPLLSTAIVFLAAAWLAPAQTANPKPPAPKSQKEVPALQALFQSYQSQDSDGTIKAAMALVTQFADSEFKATAFMLASEASRMKGDADNAVLYAEQCLEADPKYYAAAITIAQVLAQKTRENDLDREEKLGRAEKLANQAITLIQGSTKVNPQITDEQFVGMKKTYEAQAHEALGMAAMVRKKYDVCSNELKTAVDIASMPDPATMVRLGNCYRLNKHFDEAIAILDKALADANSSPQVKAAATQEKINANREKAAAAAK